MKHATRIIRHTLATLAGALFAAAAAEPIPAAHLAPVAAVAHAEADACDAPGPRRCKHP
ncbi:MAG TPA: hypothetical protein VLK84_24305 [Longimicrobium sp.]|nr:hypothetical protein [Longimicrobium sp.]